MLLIDKQTTEAAQQALKDEGATFHKFDDLTTIYGTGKFSDMKKDQVFTRVHKLVAKELVKKGYATYEPSDN